MPTAAKKVFIWSVLGKGPAGGAGNEAIGMAVVCSVLVFAAAPDAVPATGVIGPAPVEDEDA